MHKKFISDESISEQDYPRFSSDFSKEEHLKACFVHEKQKDNGCTFSDFNNFMDGKISDIEINDSYQNSTFPEYRFGHVWCLTMLYSCRMP
jgi:hypothetical protein